jgi:tetratricopeptide (TPR) repeat protein
MLAPTLGLLALGLLAAEAPEFKPGDAVVVLQSAPIRAGGKVVGTADPGSVLVVGRVGDEGLWVNFKAAGWIDPAHVAPVDAAHRHFAERVTKDGADAEALFGRGRARMAREKWSAAIADFNEAARLAPDRPAYYLARAYALTRQKRYDEALADYDYVVQLDPLDAQAYRLRAGVHVERERYADAIKDYNLASRLFPNDAALNNDRAWLLATCPDDTFRNGAQAVTDATLACELSGWQVYNRLGTLAAAYAEAGDFEQAVRWQRKCLELSPPRYRQAQQSRLRLYQSGKPYREFAGVWK